jgi:hypothetical protein
MKITIALLALTSLSMAQWGWWGPGIDADRLQGKDTTAMWKHAGTDSAFYIKGDTAIFTGALRLSGADGKGVNQGTADGSDNSWIFLSGGGGTTNAELRGASGTFYGNEVGTYGGKIIFEAGRGVSTGTIDFRTDHATRVVIPNGGGLAVESVACRSTEKLFVKGNVLVSGRLAVDSVVTAGSYRVGDTVIIRTGAAAPAFAASLRFTTYADSSQAVDTINLAALNASGARARVLCLRESVFVTNGATVINTLPAAGKWADYEYLGSPCNRWQIFGSN